MKKLSKPSYQIDNTTLSRYDLKNLIFNRVMWDPSWDGFRRMIDERTSELIEQHTSGYTRVDFALAYASWTIYDTFAGSFAWKRIRRARESAAEKGGRWFNDKYVIKDPGEMSNQVKRAAKLFGASLTGICKINHKWLYSDLELPRIFKNAIVVAVEMDPKGIATSPAIPASAATGTGYSRMGFILALLGEFIRNLGYDAVQCGNDSALSVPLAIDAGLGQLGRNGLLITPEYGPRVRLCKIFTDLPLEPDQPIDFGVTETCKDCRLCADACEVDAISKQTEPDDKVACVSNNPGAVKWYVNGELCYQFWCNNGRDCSTCISVCPYNQVPSDSRKISPEQFWKDSVR